MTKGQKILTYATGFALGCLILAIIPREREAPKEHPWHAQTALEGTYPISLQDDLGRTVQLERQPRHFISLAPSITEILFAMEMGDHLMAVTQWCDYPEEARALRDAGAQIGSMDQPNRELIATYRPDLILGTDLTPPEIYAAIENPPNTVAVALAHDSMQDVLDDVRLVGRLTGVPGKALRLVDKLQAEQAAVRSALEPFAMEAPKRVLFLLSIEESMQPGWAPGENTWVHNLIEESRATNLAAELGKSWGQVSLEGLLSMNPEILLIRDGESPQAQEALRGRIARLEEHPVWRQVEAVKTDRVHILPYGPLNIPGPRIMDAYGAVAGAVWELD
ncbi:MAG: ABC transporter substrate-binding protein [Puniceicoccaceae bacterium]